MQYCLVMNGNWKNAPCEVEFKNFKESFFKDLPQSCLNNDWQKVRIIICCCLKKKESSLSLRMSKCRYQIFLLTFHLDKVEILCKTICHLKCLRKGQNLFPNNNLSWEGISIKYSSYQCQNHQHFISSFFIRKRYWQLFFQFQFIFFFKQEYQRKSWS